jgi:hypothetical protein
MGDACSILKVRTLYRQDRRSEDFRVEVSWKCIRGDDGAACEAAASVGARPGQGQGGRKRSSQKEERGSPRKRREERDRGDQQDEML